MESLNPKSFKDGRAWRRWLEENHAKRKEIWIMYYKKGSGRPSVSHSEAVEEALCFGWIDSQIRRIDEARYVQRYTPRRSGSVWSKLNRDAAERLMDEGRMTPAGMRTIEAARKSGLWQKAYTSRRRMRMPGDLKKALLKNGNAWSNFTSFANSHQNAYIGWVADAKREETRLRRIAEVVRRALLKKKSVME